MPLLTINLRRSCLAAALLQLLALPAWAQDGAAQPAGGAEAAEQPASVLQAPEEPAEAEALPDIRRRPPRTDAEEQKFKLFKFQTDPFLAPPPPLPDTPVYSPYDWLLPVERFDTATYVVQDKTGGVIGHLTLSVEPSAGGPSGMLVLLTASHDYGEPWEAKTWLKPQTLEPVTFMRFSGLPGHPASSANPAGGELVTIGAAPQFRADYVFDRASVEQTSGSFTSRGRFRLLPYAFDASCLSLLVRQLDFRRPNWPFAATVTDPQLQTSRQLLVDKPERVTTMSAEPATYNCFELPVQLGNARERWWVERIPPHRLVKFTGGGLTYTLVRQLEH